jgi:hypothetical protein
MGELTRPYLGTDGAFGHGGVVEMAGLVRHNFLDCEVYIRGPAVPGEVDVSFRWLETAVVAGDRISERLLEELVTVRERRDDYTIVYDCFIGH